MKVSCLSIIFFTIGFGIHTNHFVQASSLEKIVYDPSDEFSIIDQYCITHADRVAAGENVIDDLVAAGLVDSFYASMTCAEVRELVDVTPSEKALQDLIDSCARDPNCGDD